MSEEPKVPQIYPTQEVASGLHGTVVTNKYGPHNDPKYVVKFFTNESKRESEISKSEEIATLTENPLYKMESINLTPTNYPDEQNFKNLVKGTTYYGAKMPYLGINIRNFLDGETTFPISTLYPEFKNILELTLKFNKEGTCHGDIRLPNMVINKEGTIRLIDFGEYDTCAKKYENLYPSREYLMYFPLESTLIDASNPSQLELINEEDIKLFTLDYIHRSWNTYLSYYTYKYGEKNIDTLLTQKNKNNLEYITTDFLLKKVKDLLKKKLTHFWSFFSADKRLRYMEANKKSVEATTKLIDGSLSLTDLTTKLKSNTDKFYELQIKYLTGDGKFDLYGICISDAIYDIMFNTWDNFSVGMIFLEILCKKYSELCTRLRSHINNKSNESNEPLSVEDQQFVKTFQLFEKMMDPQLETRITPQDAFTEMSDICKITSGGGRRKRRTVRKKHNKRRTRRLKGKH